MSATSVPEGESPFMPKPLELMVDHEGVWLKAADVVALLERAGDEVTLGQLRQALELIGGA